MGERVVGLLRVTGVALGAAVLLTGCGDMGSSALVASSVAGGGRVVQTEAPAPPNRLTVRRTRFADQHLWEEIRLTGGRSGVTMKVWVWLPPQYHDPAYRDHAFPVLMAYPGFPGVQYNSWVGGSLRGATHLLPLSSSGQAHPFVIVAPQMALSVARETECSDIPGQPKVGTWMERDVRRMVRDRYRVMAGREGWATIGASSGGYCATKIAMRRPKEYLAAVSVSGYFRVVSKLWNRAGDGRLMDENSAVNLADRRPDVRLYLTTGDSEQQALIWSQRLRAAVRAPTSVEVVVQRGGRHLTTDMQKLLPDMYRWLSRQLAAPRPMTAAEVPADPAGPARPASTAGPAYR